MALKIKRTFSEEEIKAGITMMCDPGGFARGIMRQRLVIPYTRTQTRAAQAAAADPAAIIGDWVEQSAIYMADEAVIHNTDNGPRDTRYGTSNRLSTCPDALPAAGSTLSFVAPGTN